jgi:hypothetical protein
MKSKQRASGGSASDKPDVISGNKDVLAAAERKRGGKAKKKDGGKVIGLMTGGAAKQRFDRPGRKSGGRVGANTSPLSTANTVVSAPSAPKTQQGGMS